MHLKMPKQSIICNRGSHHLCCAFAYEENVVAFLPASIFWGTKCRLLAEQLSNQFQRQLTLFFPSRIHRKNSFKLPKKKTDPCSSDLPLNFVVIGVTTLQADFVLIHRVDPSLVVAVHHYSDNSV